MESTKQHIDKMAGLINEFQFFDAVNYLESYVEEQNRIKILHLLAEEKTGILTYTFVTKIIAQYNTSFWHRAAAVLLLESLDKLPNGHLAAYYHLQVAADLAPHDWTLKEYVLHFYKEGFVSLRSARIFAEEVLKHNSDNTVAKSILKEMASFV